MKYQVSFHVTKHDIFTPENYMLFSHVERSTLLWLHVKSHLSQKSTKSEMVWYAFGVKLEHIATWRYKISHIFEQEKGLILYLCMAT